MTKVSKVESVSCQIGKSDPPTLSISARGKVNTGGWTHARLEPYVYVTPPADGIHDFEFVADKPDGMASQVISTVKAEYHQHCPEWVRGVRLHAANNTMEAMG